MNVDVVDLSKKFGTVTAVDGISLEIRDGEFVAFLGPSGCGKTTTLLMLAGIYHPTTGTILFNGRRVNELQPKDRDIGMVFQSYALYPHMSVFQNMVFSLILKRRPKQELRNEADRVARMLGIVELLDRTPGQLSGGQQQRVALARALIKRPRLLLFDEPLSNLDARLRVSMRGEIKKLQGELGITSIYVTHDQIEAMTMADRIAVIKDGRLQAFLPPDQLHDRPQTLFIAQFIGNPPMNIFTVELKSANGVLSANLASGTSLPIPEARRPRSGAGTVKMGIRPQDIHATTEGTISAGISMVEPMGRDDLIFCNVGGTDIQFLEDPGMKLRRGDTVRLSFDMEKSQFFDPETERSLLWQPAVPPADSGRGRPRSSP